MAFLMVPPLRPPTTLPDHDPAPLQPGSRRPSRMGLLPIVSANPDLQKRFWTDGLGAQYAKTDAYDLYKAPGVLIVVQKGDSRSGTPGSVVDHVALKVRDLKPAASKCQTAGPPALTPNSPQAMLLAPAQL